MKTLPMLVCVGSLAWFAASACHAQEKKTIGKGIDPATVAAYEKLGATYGGFVEHKNSGSFIRFEAGQTAADKGLPGFRFQSEPKGKLPDVSVPFGLSFNAMTDSGLKELAGLKNLATLGLAATQVTDAGLKELAGLKNLATLDLWGAKVTDVVR